MFSTLFQLSNCEPKRADWFFDLVIDCQRCGTRRRGLLLKLAGKTEPKKTFQLCHHCVTEVILNTVGAPKHVESDNNQQDGLPRPADFPAAYPTGANQKTDRRKTRHLARHRQADQAQG